MLPIFYIEFVYFESGNILLFYIEFMYFESGDVLLFYIEFMYFESGDVLLFYIEFMYFESGDVLLFYIEFMYFESADKICYFVSGLPGRRALRSSATGQLLVPRAKTATRQRRAFSIVGPSTWNGLPLEIRILPKN